MITITLIEQSTDDLIKTVTGKSFMDAMAKLFSALVADGCDGDEDLSIVHDLCGAAFQASEGFLKEEAASNLVIDNIGYDLGMEFIKFIVTVEEEREEESEGESEGESDAN